MPTAPDLQATERAVAQVRAREAAARDEAHFPHARHRAGPFALRQMLPADAVLLYATGNAVFNGRGALRCPLHDIANFVFILTAPPADGVRRHRAWHLWVTLRIIALRVRSRAWARLLLDLDDYVFRTFVDWPTGGGGSGGTRPVLGSFLSSLYDMLAARYHWPLAQIDATPLRRLMLFQKHATVALYREAKQQPPTETSPRELALWGEYLNALQRYQEALVARN